MTADTLADHLWKSRSGPAWSTWGGGHVRIFRSGLVASHHHLAATGLVTPSPLEWLPKGLFISKTVAIAMAYPPQRGVTGAARVRGALPSTFPLSPGEAVNLAWAFSLLTPTTVAAIASESQLGGPSYLWLSLATLYIYLKSGFGTPKPLPSKAALAHTNLAPLAHFLGTSTPWFWGAAPSSRVKAWSLMSNQLICFRTWYRLQCQFYDAVGST